MTALKLMEQWGKEYRKEHFGTDSAEPHIEQWISTSVYELWYGPEGHDGYPGFEPACAAIRDAIKDAPRILYVNTQTDEVATDVPEEDYDTDEWIAYDRSHVVRAIVGKDLAEYVR